MDLVSLLTSTTSKGNPNAWDISKAYYDAGADAWDISTAVYSRSSFYVGTQATGNNGVFFKPDGTKMYVVSSSADEVNEYDLSIPWLVTSATFLQDFSVATEETVPQDLFFKPDGTKMYIVGSSGDDVNEYSLSSAWDISSASYVQNFSVATEETAPRGVFFKPDGTKMYIVGSSGDDVNEYDLSSAWDISTASFVQNFSVAGQDTLPTGVFFKPNGTKMYVVGGVGDDLNEYSLSSAWDISTASFVQRSTLGPIVSIAAPTGVFFKPDGSGFFIIDGSENVYGYNVGLLELSLQDSSPESVFFKPDGTKMYVVGNQGDDINEYDLSSAWNIRTASYLQNFSISGQETNPGGLFFKPDGTKMYITGGSSDKVTSYDLSSAWDISTANSGVVFNVASQDTSPTDLFFKPDGTKMYVLGSAGEDVNEYDLSTAWDVSSASYVQNFSVSTEESSPEGMFFKDDGTKMYICGTQGDDINEYDLSSAWDISTASYLQNFSVRAQNHEVRGLFFKPDGTQLFTVNGSVSAVYSYLISPT